ncbi:MAG: type II toxin-antitoxin system VapC family toxin, partial [Actinomycetota bacterium]
MTAVYLDASAFVKLVVPEPETRALRRFLTRSAPRRVSSAIVRTEAPRAVRHIGSEALARTREALRAIDLVTVDDRILDAAAALDPGVLRTLDAIHLATALAVGEDLEVVVT